MWIDENSQTMKILVTGANGQLGRAIRKSSEKSDDCYIFTDVEELDITNPEAVNSIVDKEEIDIIVNCAAYTNVDKAEDEYDLAELLNAKSVRHLAEAIKRREGWLFHISTDYVFGGASGNTPRDETEPVNPTGVYGITKLHGEEEILKSGVKSLIFRTSWLYSEHGKNFVKTMMDLTSKKPRLNVVFDQCGTPTYAGDLAEAIVSIISERKFKGKEGIYHFSNEGVCSWYDFTCLIAEIAGNLQCEILPCHSSEFPSKVIRPSYSVLDKTKFKATFEKKIPYWINSLRICIDNLQRNV